MIALAPFAATDWFGFAGAERFPDGSEPLIGQLDGIDFDLDGVPEQCSAIVILDAVGLALDVVSEEGGPIASIFFGAPYAARALAQLRDGLSFEALRALPGAEVERSDPSSEYEREEIGLAPNGLPWGDA